MNFKKLTLISTISLALISTAPLHAGGGHSHGADDAHAEELELPRGPKGGRLFTDGHFSLELTIFESGIPPEMRLYLYHDGNPLAPDSAQVIVQLKRLGGVTDILKFKPENDYLVGNQEVVEPHSFDVEISAVFEGEPHQWSFESHEGRTVISDRLLKLSNIETEVAGPQQMNFTDTLFGVIETPQDQVFRINAPYEGMVEKVHVNIGDTVEKGQKLLTLKNTQTLQNYSVKSPSDGQVTERMVNAGDLANKEPLLKVVDFSKVWVEMSAFPENIEKLQQGQSVRAYDLHDHESAMGQISYVSPSMTGGHIARARATISNDDGHWRPGTHVKADIQVAHKQAPLAVRKTALQTFRDMDVVFAKFGNTFEVRMVELGESDGEFVEVLGGLEPGTEYVTGNSFLLKADVLKDGASHDH